MEILQIVILILDKISPLQPEVEVTDRSRLGKFVDRIVKAPGIRPSVRPSKHAQSADERNHANQDAGGPSPLLPLSFSLRHL